MPWRMITERLKKWEWTINREWKSETGLAVGDLNDTEALMIKNKNKRKQMIKSKSDKQNCVVYQKDWTLKKNGRSPNKHIEQPTAPKARLFNVRVKKQSKTQINENKW